MSYSNQTTHYGLPLPTGSDRSVWTDNNTAFEAIDGAIYTASQNATGASEAVSAMATTVTGHTASISTLNANVATLSTSVSGLESDVDTAESAISALSTRVTAVEGGLDGCVKPFKVGDTARIHGIFNAKIAPNNHKLYVVVPLNKPIDSNVTAVSITNSVSLIARFTSSYDIASSRLTGAQLNSDSAMILEFDTSNSTIESDALTYGIMTTMTYGALTIAFS